MTPEKMILTFDQLELFADCDSELAENPLWNEAEQTLYWRGHQGEIYWRNDDGEAWFGIVSKIFDNADFGYYKITVERPLRLNFAAVPRTYRAAGRVVLFSETGVQLQVKRRRSGLRRLRKARNGRRKCNAPLDKRRHYVICFQVS